jgi:hypothetical protein
MVQSPSWEANWFVASQEIPRISRNPKVHYRTHKPPPLVSILGQPNPVHKPTSHLLEIHHLTYVKTKHILVKVFTLRTATLFSAFCSTDATAAAGDGSFIVTNCVKNQRYWQKI